MKRQKERGGDHRAWFHAYTHEKNQKVRLRTVVDYSADRFRHQQIVYSELPCSIYKGQPVSETNSKILLHLISRGRDFKN